MQTKIDLIFYIIVATFVGTLGFIGYAIYKGSQIVNHFLQ